MGRAFGVELPFGERWKLCVAPNADGEVCRGIAADRREPFAVCTLHPQFGVIELGYLCGVGYVGDVGDARPHTRVYLNARDPMFLVVDMRQLLVGIEMDNQAFG
jgi:hypothetical protein